MSSFKKESGFGLVESLLVITLLAALGIIGFYVYHNHNASYIGSSGQSSAPKSVTATYLNIPELGIKLPLNSAIEDLQYKVTTPAPSATHGVVLTSKKATGAVATCNGGHTYMDEPYTIDSLDRFEGTYQPANNNGLSVAEHNKFSQQFTNFYVEFTTSDSAPCSGDSTPQKSIDSTNTLLGVMQEQIESAIRHAVEIK